MNASYTTKLLTIVLKPKTCHQQGKYRLVTYLPTILYFMILAPEKLFKGLRLCDEFSRSNNYLFL